MSSITVHKRLGLNARLTFCPKCGGEGTGLIMLGNKNHKGICPDHGHVYGIGAGTKRCIADGCGRVLIEIKELADQERVPAMELCATCQKSLKIQQEAIERGGGIAWKCSTCGSEGAILKGGQHDEMIADVRAKGYTGITFSNCPCCNKEQNQGENNNA